VSDNALSGITANQPEPAVVSKLPIRRYIRLLEESNLIESERLTDFLKEARQSFGARAEDSDFLAERLVEARLITLWHNQMIIEGKHNALLGGRHRGFFIGSYKLLSHLGTGGMNSVFLAEHTVMKRLVAIKVLPFRGEQDRRFLERFRLESRAIASLDHPNIVRAHDFNNDQSVYYLVMEYIEGKDLHHYVKERGPLPFRMAADFVRQAAEGLHSAHRSGLVHRDVKPANLLVDRKKVVKLLDLGIARLEREPDAGLSSDGSHQILGTADYLAPEQAIDSHTVDFRADVYSLGCTLYFLLTGHPPFCKGTIAQRMLAHQIQEPPSIFEDRPQAPPGLVEICQRMMAKKPEDRFRSAEEVAIALVEWADRYHQEGDDEAGPAGGPTTVSETFAGGTGGTTLGRTGQKKKQSRPTQRFRADEMIDCRTCGTQFGRYMYRSKCPRCNTINHPMAGGCLTEPEEKPVEEASVDEPPLVPTPTDPRIKATCPSCGTTFNARWTKCLCCGAATVLHDPAPPTSAETYVSPYKPQPEPEPEVEDEYAEYEYEDEDLSIEHDASARSACGSMYSENSVRSSRSRASIATSRDEDFVGEFADEETEVVHGNWVRKALSLGVVLLVLSGGAILASLALDDGPEVAEWHLNGSKKLEGHFVGDLRHGAWSGWSELGQLEWIGEYDHGVKNGHWVYLNDAGQTISEGDFEADQQQGAWTFRYDNGQIRSRGRYEAGRETGLWTFWHESGHRALVGEFVAGERVGLWTQWDEFGRLIGTRPAQEISDELLVANQSASDAT
jgi:serine/threonine protein kinase